MNVFLSAASGGPKASWKKVESGGPVAHAAALLWRESKLVQRGQRAAPRPPLPVASGVHLAPLYSSPLPNRALQSPQPLEGAIQIILSD